VRERAGGEEEPGRRDVKVNRRRRVIRREARSKHTRVERERVGGEAVSEGSIAGHRRVSQRHARTSLTLVSMM